jgi:hypothetical protein
MCDGEMHGHAAWMDTNEGSMRSRANTGVGLSRVGERSSIYRTIVRRDLGIIRYAGA